MGTNPYGFGEGDQRWLPQLSADPSGGSKRQMRKPRRWIAAILSVVSPGLGHVYAGRILPAVLIVGLLELAAVPIATLAIQRSPALTLVATAILTPAFLAGVAVHAAHVAREPTARFASRLRVVSACVAFVLASGLVSTFVEAARDRYLGEPFRVPSGAMNPALEIGDHFYTDASVYRRRAPERGDVAVFRVARDGSAIYPADRRPDLPNETFVKRVVGVPGDSIRMEGAVLTVNGKTVTGPILERSFTTYDGRSLPLRAETLGSQSYEVLDDPSRSSASTDFVVEPDRYFFAGDNRLNSNDSRYWGTVHRDDIVGKVSTIYWSWDFNGTPLELVSPSRWVELLRDRTRWTRIGIAP